MAGELSYEITTHMDADEIHDVLHRVVLKPGLDLVRSKSDLPFEGTVSTHGFVIRRVCGMRNVTPKLCGRYHEMPEGTVIRITTNIREPIQGMIGMAIGLLLPIAAMLLTVAVIGRSPFLTVAILCIIVLFVVLFVYTTQRTLEREFEASRDVLKSLFSP